MPDLCVRKITDQQRAILDLSSWNIAFNGAEPIRSETLERFAASFQPCGFRRESFFPCYGLAEATLLVAGPMTTERPIVRRFAASSLEYDCVAPARSDDQHARALVGCGRTSFGQGILIVNPDSLTPCPPNHVGEVWVSGPSVAKGYWNLAEETQRTLGAYLADGSSGSQFLRTGDMGFIHEGELFITGRLKDLIIIRGRNHYPQDIEATVDRTST